MGKMVWQMKEIYHPIVNWVDEVRKFLSNEVGKEKNWGIDQLYNTLRPGRPRRDTCHTYQHSPGELLRSYCFMIVLLSTC